METTVIKQENGQLQHATPDQLLFQAVERGLDVEKLEKLLMMKERWDKEQARKEFVQSLADFQDKCPELRKTKRVSFEMKSGGSTEYHYAPLADIDRQIKPLMKGCGLTKRWEISDSGEKLKVTCIITHLSGHSEKTEMEAAADMSGSKNAIQGKGSAIEYMKRYTLIGALGLTTADSDIDGRFSEYEYDVDKLHQQFMEIYDKIIQIDPTKSAWHPDNWVLERTGKNYVKAIGDARKVLAQLTKKAK